MTRSNAWKQLELRTAEILGGIRIHRGGDFSESLPDVIAPADWLFSNAKPDHAIIVECKYRARHPLIDFYKKEQQACKRQMRIIALEIAGKYIVIPLDCINMRENQYDLIAPKKKAPKYLEEYCTQPKRYISNLDIRDSVQLLYYKATKDRKRPPFTTFSSMAVLGQKHDRLRLACFTVEEFKGLQGLA